MTNPALKYCVALALILPPGFSYAQQSAPDTKQTTPGQKPPLVMTPQDWHDMAERMKRDAAAQSPMVTGVIANDPHDADIPLPPNGISAIQEANQFIYKDHPPTVDQDGWVTYEYGRGYPIAVLKPKQITTIRLQKGEYLQAIAKGQIPYVSGSPDITVEPKLAGTGPDAQTYLILQCTNAGQSTDVVATTNRRIYTIRALAKPMDYTPRIAFTYPDDDQQETWKAYQAAEQNQRRIEQDRKRIETDRAQIEAMREQIEQLHLQSQLQPVLTNTRYTVKSKGKEARFILPIAVGDNGVHTYLTFPADIVNYGLPVLKADTAKGPDLPNYRWDSTASRMIVDGVYPRLELLAGTGHRQQKITLTNKGRRPAETTGQNNNEVRSLARR